jgi:drug/metabolite transporter (DMT)-like permease
MTSLTAIYNTSALFCYLFSVFLLPPSRSNSLQRTKLLAIVLAALGVLVVAFGSGSSGPDEGESNDAGKDGWFGNGIAVVGAASYGLYEVSAPSSV